MLKRILHCDSRNWSYNCLEDYQPGLSWTACISRNDLDYQSDRFMHRCFIDVYPKRPCHLLVGNLHRFPADYLCGNARRATGFESLARCVSRTVTSKKTPTPMAARPDFDDGLLIDLLALKCFNEINSRRRCDTGLPRKTNDSTIIHRPVLFKDEANSRNSHAVNVSVVKRHCSIA
ncbi:hypothetical protein BKA83DRAFT_1440715 [Pisolithus microcarpus]|nr:hypothetical protein BKA83DRAFT_1440715 [Pisolithus microcarpus]